MNVHIDDEKTYVCQANLLYRRIDIKHFNLWENIIFQDYYYQNVTGKSHLLSYTNLHQIMQQKEGVDRSPSEYWCFLCQIRWKKIYCLVEWSFLCRATWTTDPPELYVLWRKLF